MITTDVPLPHHTSAPSIGRLALPHCIFKLYHVHFPLNMFYFNNAGYHAFEVSIQTFNSLPVIGEDFTMVCTFTPATRHRRLIWSKGNNIVVASHVCLPYSACTWFTGAYPTKFSLLADTGSGNLTLQTLGRIDSDNYQCTVTSTYGEENPGSSSMQVTPLSPGILICILNLHSIPPG